jgi:hypothetical protein
VGQVLVGGLPQRVRWFGFLVADERWEPDIEARRKGGNDGDY